MSFNGKKILVVGESCKDVFVYCDSKRLAPDIPVPILEEIKIVENPGMALNVLRNIRSLGVECGITTNTNWEQITKTRYMHNESNHMFMRVDTPHNISPVQIDQLDLNYDLIVISDYNKGFLTEAMIELICDSHKMVFLDTKKKLGNWASNAFIIKINNYEYKRSEQNLTDHLRTKIIRTLGSEGCEFRGKSYKVSKADVKDSSGAGDAFISALASRFLASGNIEESIVYANSCASKVVTQRGVTTIS